MALIDIGRVCVKTVGREAGETAVVVDKIDNKFVLIDGNVKRRRCNIAHLEPTEKVIKIKKGDSSETVKKALSTVGIKVKERKVKIKKEVKEEKKEVREEKKEKKKEKKVERKGK